MRKKDSDQSDGKHKFTRYYYQPLSNGTLGFLGHFFRSRCEKWISIMADKAYYIYLRSLE